MGVAAWRPIPAGVWHDDGVYMLVGKAIANGGGFVYEGVVGTPPAAKFPPLYPLVLAVLWKLLGSIGAVTMAATLLNVGLLATAGGLFAGALRVGTGLPLAACVAAAALGFASTDVLRTTPVALSEPLFLALACGAFLVGARLRSGPPQRGALLLLSGLLLALVATRTAGIALVLAFTLSTLLDRGPRAAPVRQRGRDATLIALPALAFTWWWGQWSTQASLAIPEAARDLLGPYGSWLADQTLAAPLAFVAGLPSHALGVTGRAAAILVPGAEGGPLLAAALFLTPIAAVGLVGMFRRFPPLAWFTLGYAAMLLLWPYLDRRLLTPLHPMLVALLVLGATDLRARLHSVVDRRATMARSILGAAAIVWAGAFTTVTVVRVAEGWPTAPYRLRAERLAGSVEAMRRTLPPSAIVGAPEFWAALHLHGGWTVAPSVRFDPRSVDPDAPMWGTAAEQIGLWRAMGIDHLLLEQAGRLHGAALDQLEAACPGAVAVLATLSSSMVVRVDTSGNCSG